jgi:hypothetical protein
MRAVKVYFGKFLLIAFLFSCYFLGGFIIGPVSVRMYVSVLLFFYLIIMGFRFPIYKEVFLYVLFIMVYFVALIANGELGQIDFFKYFFGRYFICFLSFYAIFSLVESKATLRMIIFTIFFFGILNVMASLLQFSGNIVALQIPLLLNVGELEQEKLIAYSGKFGLGVGVVGLFGTIVKNGYFSSIFAIVSLGIYHYSIGRIRKLFFLLISILFLITIFLIQQRLVFILVGIFYLYYVWKNPRLFKYALFLFIFLVAFLTIYELSIDSDSFGRLSKIEDTNRMIIFSSAIEFILKNLFFGGQLAFGSILQSKGLDVTTSHNLFFNAFIYAGLFGFFIIAALTGKIFSRSLKLLMINSGGFDNYFGFFLAGSLIIYNLNSFVHNSSLVTGDEHIWILLALLVKSQQFQEIESK